MQASSCADPNRIGQIYSGSKLVVHHTANKDCWAALPPALAAQLLASGVPTPLVLQLTAPGVSGEHNVWRLESSRIAELCSFRHDASRGVVLGMLTVPWLHACVRS